MTRDCVADVKNAFNQRYNNAHTGPEVYMNFCPVEINCITVAVLLCIN